MEKVEKPDLCLSTATRDFVREAWKLQRKSPWDFLHSYFYARWPYTYIGLGNGEGLIVNLYNAIQQVIQRLVTGQRKAKDKPIPSTDQTSGTIADIYHAKVLPLAPARRLVMVDKPINLPDLEQVIPYVAARAIIQQHPERILLVKCPCRMAKKNPCRPIDVCLVFGEPFASLTHQHYPSRSRWITQQEAGEVLEREDARGRVHHAFFSQMMLGRLFAICNCCGCCCTAMKLQRRGTPMLAPSGYVAQVDGSACLGCEACQEYCQFGALGLMGGSSVVNEDSCMGCGVCVSKCPQGAISLHREPAKGIPLEIYELIDKTNKISEAALS